jgi:hypothetical protein
METVDLTLLGVVVAMSLGIIEVLKILANRFIPKAATAGKQPDRCYIKVEKNISETDALLKRVAKESEKLLEMHNVRDEDGVPVWYVRRSMDDSLKTLSNGVGDLNNLLIKMHDSQNELRKSINKMIDVVSDMNSNIKGIMLKNNLRVTGSSQG